MKAIEELTKEIRRTPLSRLPDVIAAMRGDRSPVVAARAPQQTAVRAVVVVDLEHFAEEFVAGNETKGSKLASAERAIVLAALKRTNGNVSAAARLLHLDRKQLERKARRVRAAR